jgi:hypothetical protein
VSVLGVSLLLTLAGVVLLWADQPPVAGMDGATLGIALLLVGAAGGFLAMALWSSGDGHRRRREKRSRPRRRPS